MNNILTENFHVADTLNPKLFNIKTNMLLPEVRYQIIKIVKYFEDYIEVPIDICDVQLVGSQVNWTYTEHSDLDIHLIVNFDTIKSTSEILAALYASKQAQFNSKHDIKIKQIPVEFYIQDIKSNIISNGIYSVCDNIWIKEPKPLKSIPKHNINNEIKKWKKIISKVIASGDYDQIQQTLNTLYLIRHNSLAVDGEYGKGNALFKELRNLELIQKLKDAKVAVASKELTLEQLNTQKFVN